MKLTTRELLMITLAIMFGMVVGSLSTIYTLWASHGMYLKK